MDLITVGKLFKQKIDTIADYIDFTTGGIWITGVWSFPHKKERKLRKKRNPRQIVAISCAGWQDAYDSICVGFYSIENFTLTVWVDKKTRLVNNILYEYRDVEHATPGQTPGWGYSEYKRDVLENLTFEDFINKAEE